MKLDVSCFHCTRTFPCGSWVRPLCARLGAEAGMVLFQYLTNSVVEPVPWLRSLGLQHHSRPAPCLSFPARRFSGPAWPFKAPPAGGSERDRKSVV